MSVSVSLLHMGFIHPTVFLTVCNGLYVHRLSPGLLKYIWCVCVSVCVSVCVCEPLIGGPHYMRIRPRHLKSRKSIFVNRICSNIE